MTPVGGRSGTPFSPPFGQLPPPRGGKRGLELSSAFLYALVDEGRGLLEAFHASGDDGEHHDWVVDDAVVAMHGDIAAGRLDCCAVGLTFVAQGSNSAVWISAGARPERSSALIGDA